MKFTILENLTYPEAYALGQFAEQHQAKVKGMSREGQVYAMHIETPNDFDDNIFAAHLETLRDGKWVQRRQEGPPAHPRVHPKPDPDPLSRGL